MFEKPRSMSCISQIIRGSKGTTGLLSYIYMVHLTDFCFGRKKGDKGKGVGYEPESVHYVCRDATWRAVSRLGDKTANVTEWYLFSADTSLFLKSVLFAFRNQWATVMADVPTSVCISFLEIHYIKVTFVLHGQLQIVLQVSYNYRDVSSLVLFPQSTVGTMSLEAKHAAQEPSW